MAEHLQARAMTTVRAIPDRLSLPAGHWPTRVTALRRRGPARLAFAGRAAGRRTRVWRGRVSQMRTVVSPEPLARVEASGEKAREKT